MPSIIASLSLRPFVPVSYHTVSYQYPQYQLISYHIISTHIISSLYSTCGGSRPHDTQPQGQVAIHEREPEVAGQSEKQKHKQQERVCQTFPFAILFETEICGRFAKFTLHRARSGKNISGNITEQVACRLTLPFCGSSVIFSNRTEYCPVRANHQYSPTANCRMAGAD